MAQKFSEPSTFSQPNSFRLDSFGRVEISDAAVAGLVARSDFSSAIQPDSINSICTNGSDCGGSDNYGCVNNSPSCKTAHNTGTCQNPVVPPQN